MHLHQNKRVSQRRACFALGFSRSTIRYRAKARSDEAALVQQLAELRVAHPYWGYRKMAQLLREEGWKLNDKRVERVWREHGWQQRAAKAGRKRGPGHEDNACHVRKATCGNEVWAIDFVKDVSRDGKALKMLTVSDEYTREGLAVEVARSMGQRDVQRVLGRLFRERGAPKLVRSDNGSEFTGKWIEKALSACGVESAWIAPGSPWQNGKNERFNGILRHELLSREVFENVVEAQVMCSRWLKQYNEVRPHGSLKMKTPATYAEQAKQAGDWYLSPSP